jgi:hypothetical protein
LIDYLFEPDLHRTQEFFSKSIPLQPRRPRLGSNHGVETARMLREYFASDGTHAALYKVAAHRARNGFADDKAKAGVRQGLIPL